MCVFLWKNLILFPSGSVQISGRGVIMGVWWGGYNSPMPFFLEWGTGDELIDSVQEWCMKDVYQTGIPKIETG